MRRLGTRTLDEGHFALACVRSGMVGLEPPGRLVRILDAVRRNGLLTLALAIGAIRHSARTALADERGELTYRGLDERTNALATAWRARGLKAGDSVAILARNHRGFVEAAFAAAKCGTRIVLLNTSFAGPQVREVTARESIDLLVHDDEYTAMLDGVQPRLGRIRTWLSEPSETAPDTIDALITGVSTARPPRAGRAPKIIILTSGTTGTPKGASRDEPRSLGVIGAILGRVPFRAEETTVLAVPLFHALGFATMALGLSLGSTIVLQRQFDAEATLDALAQRRASALIVVPVMLQRILELAPEAVARRDLSELRVIFVSGSAASVDLVRRAERAFGPVLYNMYASTEVAEATIATPADLAVAPSTVGRPVRGTVIRIYDEQGRPTPNGDTGRIFVGNATQFEGYTGGESKPMIDGLMSTGDVGHFDADGRLYIDGRDDEMIVSGGENVFPAEVENLLAGHEAIVEAAAIGVPDDAFGHRLRAFVVIREGHVLSEDEVRAYVRENLARYKVPRDVTFLEQLPRNPTGKVLKRTLVDD